MHSQAEHAVLKVLHVAAALQAPQPELGGGRQEARRQVASGWIWQPATTSQPSAGL